VGDAIIKGKLWTNGELFVGDAIIKGKLWTRLCGQTEIQDAEFSV
jgi:hypothetical protein